MQRFAHSAALAIALMLTPFAVQAQGSPVVVELYTSQGCSSCPPADRFLGELAAREGVIALALHVDYWDYLGWKDNFGSAANTKRQRGYAKAAKTRTIYTPQMIVGGRDMLVGSRVEAVNARIEARRAEPAPVELDLRRDGGGLRIAVAPKGAEVGAAEVHVVRFVPSATVAIEAGENAGRSITYTNVVTDWQTVGRWDGHAPAEFSAEAGGDGPVAVIVQRERMGPVLTAAELR